MTDREKVARAIHETLAQTGVPETMFTWSACDKAPYYTIADAALSAMQGDGWKGVEPVAWLYKRGDKTRLGLEYSEDMVPAWDATPLYALPAPPKENPA